MYTLIDPEEVSLTNSITSNVFTTASLFFNHIPGILIVGMVSLFVLSFLMRFANSLLDPGEPKKEEKKVKVETEIESALRIAEKSNILSKEIRDNMQEIEREKKEHYKKYKKYDILNPY